MSEKSLGGRVVLYCLFTNDFFEITVTFLCKTKLTISATHLRLPPKDLIRQIRLDILNSKKPLIISCRQIQFRNPGQQPRNDSDALRPPHFNIWGTPC